jgi:hypothetical protein
MSARLGDSEAVLARLRAIVPEFRSSASMEAFSADEPVASRRAPDVRFARFGGEAVGE